MKRREAVEGLTSVGVVGVFVFVFVVLGVYESDRDRPWGLDGGSWVLALEEVLLWSLDSRWLWV